MDNSYIYNRHSVRKFKDEEVSIDALKEIIKAGSYAPSGKNSQNWHFVILRGKDQVDKIASAIEKKNKDICDKISDETIKNKFLNGIKYQLTFKSAQTLILVYARKYTPTGYEELKLSGAPEEEIKDLWNTAPGIQGVSAALENIMLTAANMGYGTCWITGPDYAAKEINEVIGFEKEDYSLIAMTPIGVPLSTDFKRPPRKPLEEIMTIIE